MTKLYADTFCDDFDRSEIWDQGKMLKGLEGQVALPAGIYTRAELLALAMGQLKLAVEGKEVDVDPIKETMEVAAQDPNAVLVNTAPVSTVREESVDDERMLSEIKGITWDKEGAPRGKPGIRLFFQTLAWLRSDERRKQDIAGALTPKGGKGSKRNLSEVVDVAIHLPIGESAGWMFAILHHFSSTTSLHAAFVGDSPELLVTELWDFGFDMDGIRPNTNASQCVDANERVAAIVSGRREDGKREKGKVDGSCAAVMRALKQSFDSLPEEHRGRMHDHMLTNCDTDLQKALMPLGKLMEKSKCGPEFRLIRGLVQDGKIPVGALALVFKGEWGQLYGALTNCLSTIGPRPPWVDPKAR